MSNPYVEDTAFWEAALEHYHWDRMAEAYGQIEAYGIGEAGTYLRWYRVIEAEAVTRQRSRRVGVNTWLTFEYVPEEIMELKDAVIRRALAACDDVAGRLGWRHGSPTLVSILAEETDAPWSTSPFGYCVHKEPYDKICLPNYLIDDPDEFQQAVAHEYAHVICDSLSDGHAPRWLEEAVSVLAERSLDQATWEAFRQEEAAWLQPSDLEWTLENPGTDDEDPSIWHAYQQCGWLGRFLVDRREEAKLADLLREHQNESVLRHLKMALTNQTRVDAALKAVYGLTTEELFREAFAWVKQSSWPGDRNPPPSR